LAVFQKFGSRLSIGRSGRRAAPHHVRCAMRGWLARSGGACLLRVFVGRILPRAACRCQP
jgi:hypothetical protein